MNPSNNPINKSDTTAHTDIKLANTNSSQTAMPVTIHPPANTNQQFQLIGPKFIELFKKVIKKLVVWFIFTVVIGLLPIIANWLLDSFHQKSVDPSELFFRGELLIIAFALSADAMGDLVNSNKLNGIIHVVLFGICFVLFALSGLVFAGLGIIGDQVDKHNVSTFSIFILGASFIASMGCKILTEV